MKHRALFLAVLVGGTAAFAQAPQGTAPIPSGAPVAPPPEAPPPASETPSTFTPPVGATPAAGALAAAAPADKRLGFSLDVGFPDFLGLNGIFRPMHWLRLHAGPLYNGSGLGLRGGVSLVPFNFAVTPAATFEYGRYFRSSGTSIVGTVNRFVEPDISLGAFEPLVRNLSYEYVSAHLGLEFGPPQTFVFYLRGGLTFLTTTLAGSQETLQNITGDPTLSVQDFNIRGAFPALKLGFIVYLG